jgi:2-haloacid dehalogenase
MSDRIRAFVFDAYGTLLDVNAAVKRHMSSFGETADAFASMWRPRQLEYSWSRMLMNRYADFWTVTEEALEVHVAHEALKERLLSVFRAGRTPGCS